MSSPPVQQFDRHGLLAPTWKVVPAIHADTMSGTHRQAGGATTFGVNPMIDLAYQKALQRTGKLSRISRQKLYIHWQKGRKGFRGSCRADPMNELAGFLV